MWFVLFWSSLFAVSPAVKGDAGHSPVERQDLQVVVFLHPDCVISRYYTATLGDLMATYGHQGVAFQAVFPGFTPADPKILAFRNRFDFPLPCTGDPEGEMVQRLGATITPEVFLLNGAQEILYSGRIDDTYYRIGGRRPQARQRDLEEALNSALEGKPVVIKHRPAIGCLINISALTHSP